MVSYRQELEGSVVWSCFALFRSIQGRVRKGGGSCPKVGAEPSARRLPSSYVHGKVKTRLDDCMLHLKRKSAPSTEKLQMDFMKRLDKSNEVEGRKQLISDKAYSRDQPTPTWASSLLLQPWTIPQRSQVRVRILS